ncbi:MAG: DNA repair protein RadA [Planctomycetota bacterium]
MAKAKTRFVCASCGSDFPKWAGRCPDCGTWDALEEVRVDASATKDVHRALGGTDDAVHVKAVPITQVGDDDTAGLRIASGIGEFDRVLGGGLVPGSAVLVGGDPGIGKSTLMLQAAGRLAREGRPVLYVCAEESAAQVRMRAERLTERSNVSHELPEKLFVLADTNLARIIEATRKLKPAAVVIDSIQMIYKGDLPAAPGSVTQLRTCTLELVYQAKQAGHALLLVGHVTKSGTLAGPKLLEHMVDAVLAFEGDRYHAHRVVRAVKNRFGNTLEVGLFEMTGTGLREVDEGGSLLTQEHEPRPGSVVCPVLTGSRCLLVEIQALTATGFLGSTKRKASGLDGNRLAMLLAVLEKRAELRLADQDVFTSSVGGMKIGEPAVDLALALAIAGAHLGRSLPAKTCAVGEVGLGGELRPVQQMDRRVAEAARLGFGRVLLPAGTKVVGKGAEAAQLVPMKSLDAGIQDLG